MTTTTARHRATFLLEVALDAARINEQIAERLRAERLRRRLTQEKMAPLVGLSYRQYQRLEAGQSMPRWSSLEQIAERLDLDVGDLLSEEEASQPAEQPAGRAGDDDRLARVEEGLGEVRDLLRELLGRPSAPQAVRPARRRTG